MPSKKIVIHPSSPMMQAALARELRKVLTRLRQQGTILPSTLPPITLPPVRPGDTTTTTISRAVQNALPPARTPAEQTARPGLIRRAIRAITNRLARFLSGGGRRGQGATGRE